MKPSHVQSYTGSYWMLSLGGYSLRIAHAAAMATANKTLMKNVPSLLAILMALAVRWYYHTHCLMEEVHGFP